VVNAYRNPEKLGVDRWLALIAVHRRTRAPACIVDCGTAVTFDGLDPEGRHLGGLILPGLRMMQDALLGHTQIGLLSPVDGVELLARDTAGAVTSGALFACAGLLELVVGRIARECGRVPEVVLTGSDGAKLQAVLETGSGYEPDLVLQGLAELAGDDGA
jgi:type III pantothenate kinase